MKTISDLQQRVSQLEALLVKMNAVEEQNRIFRAAIQQSPTGIAISDEHGKIEFANAGFTKILGYHPEEINRKILSSLMGDDESRIKFRIMSDAFQKGNEWSGEVRVIRKNRQIVWIRLFVFPIIQESGINKFVTIIVDINNLKIIEIKRQEQDAVYQTLVENIPLGIATFDANGKIFFANEIIEKTLGMEKGSASGKTVHQVFPPETAVDQIKLIRKVFKTGKPVNADRQLRLDGRVMHLKVTRRPLFSENGKVTGVLAIAQDMTEHTRQDQMMNILSRIDSLSNITTNLQLSLDIVFKYLMQIDWVDCGGFYHVNNEKKILEMVYHTGLSEDFIKNTSVYSFDSGNARLVFDKKPKFVRVGSYISSSDEDVHKEKITFIAALPLVFHDRVIGLLNLASKSVKDLDETDRQAIKTIALKIANLIELIQTREELDRSNSELKEHLIEIRDKQQLLIQKSRLESLGELLAGLAHEINQPLSVISLAMENINYKMHQQGASEDYLAGKFNSITQNINKIKDLIDHVRIFSHDRGTVIFERIDVNQVILNALSMIESQLRSLQIKVVTELPAKIGYSIGNPSRLEQVILNLVSNARDALVEKEKKNPPGKLSKEIRIKTYIENDCIMLCVRDNGTGISEKNMEKIFNPFFTTKAEGLGTGLGLSIVYGIINEMKGEIAVNSREGVSTEIIISLPRY